MNPNQTEFKFPQIKAHPCHKTFHKSMPPKAVDLVLRLLQYSPNLRCTALSIQVFAFYRRSGREKGGMRKRSKILLFISTNAFLAAADNFIRMFTALITLLLLLTRFLFLLFAVGCDDSSLFQ